MQKNQYTLKQVENPTLWHLAEDGIEDLFPEERVKKGGRGTQTKGTGRKKRIAEKSKGFT